MTSVHHRAPQAVFHWPFILHHLSSHLAKNSGNILKEWMGSWSGHLCSLPLTKEELASETKERLNKREMEMSKI